jgi:hypothetical protein
LGDNVCFLSREAGKNKKRKLSRPAAAKPAARPLFADPNNQRVDLRLPQLAPRIFQLL